jgi:hypothetical protein
LVGLTFNGNTISLYLNGTLINQASTTITQIINPSFEKCNLAEVILYNKSLQDYHLASIKNYIFTKYDIGYSFVAPSSLRVWIDAADPEKITNENNLITEIYNKAVLPTSP